ncbi:MAG TPA: capsule assembly Wzi family protein [Flavisolibacter sp.]|jgi:hypothetical protein|nr:capsule assembly Wzi family protein [Flavisolibacter sp.]
MKNPSILLFGFFLWGLVPATGQTLPVGTPLLEETLRRSQLNGNNNQDISFTIRPLFRTKEIGSDSLQSQSDASFQNKTLQRFLSGKSFLKFGFLNSTFKQQFNSDMPYGWNDGPMVPAKGFQSQLSFGFYTKAGPLSLQVMPEIIYAQNASFRTFPSTHTDSVWNSYYMTVLNMIDAPERFGNRSYTKIFPGQSSIRINHKKFSLGFSTENLWWGPGVRNSLLMSNNAPGFQHFTLNTTAPVLTPIGSFEGQLISGFLNKSGFLPPDTARRFNNQPLFITKPDEDRYLNGLVISWQPRWTKGFFIGFSRVFYLYRSDVETSFAGYLPVIGQVFKGSERRSFQEDSLKRDQMLSLFFRWLMPKEKAEIYAEYGRNDFAGDMRDLMLEPEHSRAFIIGLKKICSLRNQSELELFAEITHLQMPATFLLREQGNWYAHYQVRDGYTHRGQVIGAGIGTGGNNQVIGINYIKGMKKTGVFLERVVHNNDFYYNAFSPNRDYWSHWVDLSVNFNRSWRHQQFLYDIRLSWTKVYNYQWQKHTDAQNLHAGFSISYIF